MVEVYEKEPPQLYSTWANSPGSSYSIGGAVMEEALLIDFTIGGEGMEQSLLTDIRIGGGNS